MRVAVVPTGRTEWEALPDALRRLFPGHEFECLPTREEVSSNEGIEFPIPSFTSCDATILLGRANEGNNADKLVARAAAEALGDRKRSAADLVVMLDDLELANRTQPQIVATVMREAVLRHIGRLEVRSQERTCRALRERVSFHLAVPMIESWLFADPLGPVNAGAPPTRLPRLQAVDPEDFETNDEGYATASIEQCTCWQSLPSRRASQVKRRKKLRPAWAGEHDRARHPKGYMQWLCFAPSTKSCTTYEESSGGVRALRALDWAHVLARFQMPFLRALVADIADALGQTPSIDGPFEAHQALLTGRTHAARDAVLRNV